MSKSKSTELDFETSLQELTVLVEQMEKGNINLETSLKYFEQGVTLIRQCQILLKNAEQRIQIYKGHSNQLEPFQKEND